MIAASAQVPSTCMIWQVVPSTCTCKSINLDLARAARYQYFTENRPAHADQNSVQPSIFSPPIVLLFVLLLLRSWRPARMGTMSPDRSACSRPIAHTHTQARPHTLSHTHTHSTQPVPPGSFIHYRSYSRT